MELSGKIIAVLPAQSGTSKSGNQWMTQSYVIEVPGQYSRKCVFSVFGADRIQQFGIQMGEELTISFDIDAHEYNGKWFNEIRAYNVVRGQVLQQGYMPQQGFQQPMQQMPPQQPMTQSPFPPQQPMQQQVQQPQAGQGTLPFPPQQ